MTLRFTKMKTIAYLILLSVLSHASLGQENSHAAENPSVSEFDGFVAEYAKLDPLELYDTQQEIEKKRDAALGEAELAAPRVQEYQDYINSFPPMGQRSPEQEHLLVELENLKSNAAFLERRFRKKAEDFGLQLSAIDSIMNVTTRDSGIGRKQIFVTVNIPGRPPARDQRSLEDQLNDILDEQFVKGEKERKQIVDAYLQYLKDVSDLREASLDEMKANNEAFRAELHRDYEREISIRQARGQSTKDLEAPPGYEEPKTPSQNKRDPLKAIPARGS